MRRKKALLLTTLAAAFCVFAVAAWAGQDVEGGNGKAVSPLSPIDTIVYLVLMAGSPPLHMIEMPSMEKCQAAARHTSNAKCITTEAVGLGGLKSKVGGIGHLRRLPARSPQGE